MTPDNAQQLTNMGLAAVLMVINFVLWRELVARTQAHIEDLREIAGLRTQLRSTQRNVIDYREGNGTTRKAE